MYWLLGMTFLHVVGEGGLALYESIRIGSLALLAFGIESIIEGGAALLAVRHLRTLADEEHDHARNEQILARWIGISFLLLAAYTTGRGIIELTRGTQAERSVLGLLLTIFASFGMPLIGYWKLKTSRALGSQGLAAEAKESIACSADSMLTLLAMLGGTPRSARMGGSRAFTARWCRGSCGRASRTFAAGSMPISTDRRPVPQLVESFGTDPAYVVAGGN